MHTHTYILHIHIYKSYTYTHIYPNIPHSECLTSLQRVLQLRGNKQISSDTLIELAEVVLKSNIFQFDEKLLNRYVEPQLEQSLHLHMLFSLWLT